MPVVVRAPHRARQRAGLVAQLEVDGLGAHAEVGHLAEHLHAGQLAQPRAQRRRVLAHRERALQLGAVDPGGAGARLFSPLPLEPSLPPRPSVHSIRDASLRSHAGPGRSVGRGRIGDSGELAVRLSAPGRLRQRPRVAPRRAGGTRLRLAASRLHLLRAANAPAALRLPRPRHHDVGQRGEGDADGRLPQPSQRARAERSAEPIARLIGPMIRRSDNRAASLRAQLRGQRRARAPGSAGGHARVRAQPQSGAPPASARGTRPSCS